MKFIKKHTIMLNAMESFADWLDSELKERGWSRSEAARRAGISASMIDKVINEYANAGLDFCNGMARALRVPPEDVFRRAGILPPIPTDEEYRELVELLPLLSTDALVMLRRMAYALAQTEEPTRG